MSCFVRALAELLDEKALADSVVRIARRAGTWSIGLMSKEKRRGKRAINEKQDH
jgi:hypothetical protein